MEFATTSKFPSFFGMANNDRIQFLVVILLSNQLFIFLDNNINWNAGEQDYIGWCIRRNIRYNQLAPVLPLLLILINLRQGRHLFIHLLAISKSCLFRRRWLAAWISVLFKLVDLRYIEIRLDAYVFMSNWADDLSLLLLEIANNKIMIGAPAHSGKSNVI